MNTLKRHPLGTALIAAALLVAVGQGCNDNNDNPAPPDVTTGGSNSSAGKSSQGGSAGKGGGNAKAGSGDEAGTTGNEGGTASTDGGNGPTVGGGDDGGAGGGPPEPACSLPELGADGCFNCPNNGVVTQWLNRCTDADCEPFDNAARLPQLNADGTVPSLPN